MLALQQCTLQSAVRIRLVFSIKTKLIHKTLAQFKLLQRRRSECQHSTAVLSLRKFLDPVLDWIDIC